MFNDVLLCEPVRTPVGSFGGSLKSVSASELAAVLIRHVMLRGEIPEGVISDVILGHANPSGDDPAIGRIAALDAGLPVATAGMQVDRRCGSGLQAILQGFMQVATGGSRAVVAGGVENMSRVEHYTRAVRWGVHSGDAVLTDRLARARVAAGGRGFPVLGGMIETAENLRRAYSISRDDQDRLALESHRRAQTAQLSGVFEEEIVPVATGRGGAADSVIADEHPRHGLTMEKLSALRPVLASTDPEATVTAGNASGQNDGAALCVIARRTDVEAWGLTPYAKLRSWAVTGVDPRTMGLGPVDATRTALDRAGLALADIDLVEINEAFAVQVLACLRELGLNGADMARVNVHGSGISLGHPIGATGARIACTLTREMARREVDYGLETLCIGGGQGIAAVFQSVY